VEPFTFRPIDKWPGELTRHRQRARFSASWGRTLALLNHELHRLGARNVVLQVAMRESDIRLDGRPRAKARADHPGIILAFASRHGPLKYTVDTYDRWEDNLRAIALALEALRAVDRYGVTKRGEQYTGFRAIEQHTGSGFESAEDAAVWMERRYDDYRQPGDAMVTREEILDGLADDAYKFLARKLHPDAQGGSHEEFVKLQDAIAMISG